jgi:hypothetical protein
LADIPTINIAALVAHHPNLASFKTFDDLHEDASRVVRKISRACEDIGFYNVVGHGLPMTALDVSKLQAQLQPMCGGLSTNDVLAKCRCDPGKILPDFR